MLRNKYAILGTGLGVQNSHSFLLHLFPLIFSFNYLLIWPPSFFMVLSLRVINPLSYCFWLMANKRYFHWCEKKPCQTTKSIMKARCWCITLTLFPVFSSTEQLLSQLVTLPTVMNYTHGLRLFVLLGSKSQLRLSCSGTMTCLCPELLSIPGIPVIAAHPHSSALLHATNFLPWQLCWAAAPCSGSISCAWFC